VTVTLAVVIAIVCVALFFDYTNGFHDAANAIATSVSTRALTPRVALAMAAVLNLVGAYLGESIAKTVGSGIITPPEGMKGLAIVLAALLGAIAWNLLTWYFGLPSSSSHALIGGLVGAALISGSIVQWRGVTEKVLIPMIVSPLIGFTVAGGFSILLVWIVRRGAPGRINRGFRYAQWFSSAAMALGHGLQDAQKTMGVIVLALAVGGYYTNPTGDIPGWVKFAAAAAIALGTWSGGARIMKTLGRGIIQLDPLRGFAAQTVASSVLYTAAYALQAPISTTHTITSSVMGVGATKKFSAVRWGAAGNIMTAWVFTIPGAGLVAALAYLPISLMIR
jgi:inorganic phosphate transporter, PiT family